MLAGGLTGGVESMRAVIGGLALVAFLATSAAASTLQFTYRLEAGGGLPWAVAPVALSGDRAVVGRQTFDARTGAPGPTFGEAGAVSPNAVSGDRVLVGTGLHDVTTGDLVARIDPATVAAMEGTRLVTGVTRTFSPYEAGRVYSYDTTSGARITEIVSPESRVKDGFGAGVAVSGSRTIVSAGNASFAAAVFDTDTGRMLASLPSDSGYGTTVAIAGDYALIPHFEYDDHAQITASSVLLWDYVSGGIVRRFDNPGPNLDTFGRGLAIDGDRVLVGAPAGVGLPGHAYLFDRDTGALLQSLSDPAGTGEGWFGFDVALSGGRALIGSDGGAYLMAPVIAPVPAPAGGLLAVTAMATLAAFAVRRQRAAIAATSASGAASASPAAARNRSASSAAMQPIPALVTAWR